MGNTTYVEVDINVTTTVTCLQNELRNQFGQFSSVSNDVLDDAFELVGILAGVITNSSRPVLNNFINVVSVTLLFHV